MLLTLTATLMLGTRIISRQQLIGLGRLMEYSFRNKMYRHLLTLPQSFYATHPTGELMSRITNDVQAIRYLCGGGSLLGFNTLFAYIMTVPVMISYSPRLTLYAFLLLPVAILLMSLISRRVKKQYFKVQEVLADVSSIAQENFSGMSVIQSYVKEADESQRFSQVSKRYLSEFTTLIRHRVWLFLIMALITSLGVLIILAEGGREFIADEIDIGVFIAFILLLERLSWPTAAMGWTLTMIQQGTAAMERFHQVFSIHSDLTPTITKQTPYNSPFPQGPIEFSNLNFTYPHSKSKTKNKPEPALIEINLKLELGKTYVIVGKVGCGKSTLLSLIPKLHKVDDGCLTIGRRDINSMPLEAIRKIVTYMSQHSFLFSSTIEKNIAYGQPKSQKEKIIEASKTASLHQEILNFSDEYKTQIGERGITLSGGQRQRMALARSILLEAPILLLDDPFSNVDSETEQMIISALKARQTSKNSKNKITLIASHRLSVIQNADAIILMDQGKILAMGSHQELMESQTLYKKMHQVQRIQRQFDELWQDQRKHNKEEHEPSKNEPQ